MNMFGYNIDQYKPKNIIMKDSVAAATAAAVVTFVVIEATYLTIIQKMFLRQIENVQRGARFSIITPPPPPSTSSPSSSSTTSSGDSAAPHGRPPF